MTPHRWGNDFRAGGCCRFSILFSVSRDNDQRRGCGQDIRVGVRMI